MKRLNYYEVNPGGNITAIMKSSYPVDKRLVLARSILEKNKKVEQVGFWLPARTSQSRARLEMAGGEFCGNATRALAALTANDRKPFLLETSGIPTPIIVQANKKQSSISLPLSSFKLRTDVCTLPGITHILIKNFQPTKENAQNILRNKGLLRNTAAGVIGYNVRDSTYTINPVVWVRAVKTLYEETACASGTLALAYALWRQTGRQRFSIKQPSGATFKLLITAKNITLNGPVYWTKKRSITFKSA